MCSQGYTLAGGQNGQKKTSFPIRMAGKLQPVTSNIWLCIADFHFDRCPRNRANGKGVFPQSHCLLDHADRRFYETNRW